MARTKTEAPKLELTPDEVQAILSIRQQQEAGTLVVDDSPSTSIAGQQFSVADLAAALTAAMEAVKPKEKKTVANRKKNTPWTPKDGSPKILTLKRKMYQHGIELDPKKLTNEVCKLLDQIKPGSYCGGHVKVTRRRSDGGYDIDYPIRTAAQRLKMSSQFGITSFEALLKRLVDEKNDPSRYRSSDDDED